MRVDIYSRMTDAGNPNSTHFEEVLGSTFHKYVSLYNTLEKNNLIKKIKSISCINPANDFEIEIVVKKSKTNLHELKSILEYDIMCGLDKSHSVEVNVDNENTLIIIIKGGE